MVVRSVKQNKKIEGEVKTRKKWSKTQSESVIKWVEKWKREELMVKKMKTKVD